MIYDVLTECERSFPHIIDYNAALTNGSIALSMACVLECQDLCGITFEN